MDSTTGPDSVGGTNPIEGPDAPGDVDVNIVVEQPAGVRNRVPRWVGPAYIIMALILVPWIIYLRYSLPISAVATHYRTAWVGFDILEFGQLIRTGIYALIPRWRYRVRPHAAACATLLSVDAWFDCTTSPTSQLPASIAMAVLVELPLAGICWWLALRAPEHRPAVSESVSSESVSSESV